MEGVSMRDNSWVVEVLGDGTSARHQRFLVGADDRDTAIKAVMHVVGADVVVTSSMKLSDRASEIAEAAARRDQADLA
jgi:hypothetical protein